MMSAKEGLRLLDVLSDVHFVGIDSTEKEFRLKTGLVHLANRDAVPLSRGQEFLKNLLVPLHGRGLDEIQLAVLRLDLGQPSGLEGFDDYFVKSLQALRECIEVSLQAKSLVDEGGQVAGCLRIAVGLGLGCHVDNTTGCVRHSDAGKV